MRKINVPYTVTTSNGIEGIEQHCVVQNYGMRLVGTIRLFQPTPKGEYGRRMFLENTANPYQWAKAKGLRIYIKLAGAFRYISPEDTEAYKDDIHAALQDMVEHYATTITDGMMRQYADCDVEPCDPSEYNYKR